MDAGFYFGDPTLRGLLACWAVEFECPLPLADYWLEVGEDDFAEAVKVAVGCKPCSWWDAIPEVRLVECKLYPHKKVNGKYTWWSAWDGGENRFFCDVLPWNNTETINLWVGEAAPIERCLLNYFDLYRARPR